MLLLIEGIVHRYSVCQAYIYIYIAFAIYREREQRKFLQPLYDIPPLEDLYTKPLSKY